MNMRNPKCSICNSKLVDKLNRDMVLHAMSAPKLAEKYGFLTRQISRHRGHVGNKLALAQERKEHTAAERLLEEVDTLWEESKIFLETSKEAVKTQSVTIGKGKNRKTVYKEYRDLGATATALRVAHENRRLFGEVTGAIRPPVAPGGTGMVLHIVIPGMPGLNQAVQPAIETTAEEVDQTP